MFVVSCKMGNVWSKQKRCDSVNIDTNHWFETFFFFNFLRLLFYLSKKIKKKKTCVGGNCEKKKSVTFDVDARIGMMNFLFGRHVLASLCWSQRQKKIFLCLDSLLGVYQQILWLTDVCRYSSCISLYYYHFFKPTSLWIVVDSETWPQAMAKSKFIAQKNDKRRRVLKPLHTFWHYRRFLWSKVTKSWRETKLLLPSKQF